MTTAADLARMTEPKLRAWLLARVREQHIDPPIDAARLESPEDFPRLVYNQTRDKKFRARLKNAILGALDELSRGHLHQRTEARAIAHLAALVDDTRLHDAVRTLQRVADLGAFGGHSGRLHPDAEEKVLLALASLQPRDTLWPKWLALWQRDTPHLWPAATVGLRLSAPERALEILPEAVHRAMKHPEFPLGEVLWSFATADAVTDADVARALADLSPAARKHARVALATLGAEEAQLDAWLPDNSKEWPSWAYRSDLKRPPSQCAEPGPEGHACP